jgi:hypothetical protein
VADLGALTADDFAPHLHERFVLSPLELELVEVTGAGRPFSLVFRGPAEPLLPQRIHRVEHPALGPLDLFLVPVGPGSYEAIFT